LPRAWTDPSPEAGTILSTNDTTTKAQEKAQDAAGQAQENAQQAAGAR